MGDINFGKGTRYSGGTFLSKYDTNGTSNLNFNSHKGIYQWTSFSEHSSLSNVKLALNSNGQLYVAGNNPDPIPGTISFLSCGIFEVNNVRSSH